MIRDLVNLFRIGWMTRLYKTFNNMASTSAAAMAIQTRLLLVLVM